MLAILVLALGLVTVSLAQEDTWTKKANMPTPRMGLSTSAVDGKIYAIGGWASWAGTILATVEEYDPVTDTWTKKADMPTARHGFSTNVVNGKIYAIGGWVLGVGPSSIVEEYDPATDTWTKKANMPTARCYFPSSAVNGKIYAIGGWKGPLSTVEEYDPGTDTWTRKANMPTARLTFSTSAVNGKIYAIGGVDAWAGAVLSTVEEYDPATDTWTKKADMPTARRDLSTSAVNEKIYAIGGNESWAGVDISTVEEYDVAMDTWTKKTDMPTARGYFSTSVVNEKIYAIGGVPAWEGGALSTVEEYYPISPVFDFNGDGIVDCADICLMIDHWHTDEPFFDIAPSPFGDGIVDIQDLIVLAEHLFEDYRVVAHWKLDENEGDIAYDSAGNNHGTLNGNPVWQPTGGKIDGTLEFDGIDDYISTSFVLNPAKGSLSVFAWIKGGAPGQVIISQTDVTVGRTTNQGSAWLWADSSYGRLITRLMHPPFDPLVSESVITDGQWHHVGLVYDFDGLYRYLYVDGVEVARDTDVVGGVGSDGGLYFGAGKTLDAGSFFCGLIDDVRIYNEALSAEEIEYLAR